MTALDSSLQKERRLSSLTAQLLPRATVRFGRRRHYVTLETGGQETPCSIISYGRLSFHSHFRWELSRSPAGGSLRGGASQRHPVGGRKGVGKWRKGAGRTEGSWHHGFTLIGPGRRRQCLTLIGERRPPWPRPFLVPGE